jgi:hypothetical protein
VNGKEVVCDTVQGVDMGLLVRQGSTHEYIQMSGTIFEETIEPESVKVLFRVEELHLDMDVYARVHVGKPMFGDVFTLIIFRHLLEMVLFRSTGLTKDSIEILEKATASGVLDSQELFKRIRTKVMQLCGQKQASFFVNIPRSVTKDMDGLKDDPSYVRFKELFEKLRGTDSLGYNELGFLLQYANGLSSGTSNRVSLQFGLLEEFFVYAPSLPRAFYPVTDPSGLGKLVTMPFSLTGVCALESGEETPLVEVIGDGHVFHFCVNVRSMRNYEAFKEAVSYKEPAAAEDEETSEGDAMDE